MKTIGAFEAKTSLSKYLDSVEHHREEIIIQRHGKNIAKLVPYSDEGDGEKSARTWEGLRRVREEGGAVDAATAVKWAKEGRR
jgi:prevent-host-death family protein